MGGEISLADAIADLRERTLSSFSSDLARLVYLSSTRDYLTGRYHHDGLAFRFTAPLAEIAVGFCHHELFEKMATATLKELVRELEVFMRSQGATLHEALNAWKSLEPYRMLVPQSGDSVSKEFFFSNVRISLAILEPHLRKIPEQDQQAASLRQ
jgi:hypothetical protein